VNPRRIVKLILFALAEMQHGRRARLWGCFIDARRGIVIKPVGEI
jgi:hypothetical protein